MYCFSAESSLLRLKRRKYNVGKCDLIITEENGTKTTIELTGEPPRVYYKSFWGIVYHLVFQPTIPAISVAEFAIKELYEGGYLIHDNRVIDKFNVASIKIDNVLDFDAEEKIVQL